MRVKTAVALSLACLSLSACAVSGEESSAETVKNKASIEQTGMTEQTSAESESNAVGESEEAAYEVDWDKIRVEPFECSSYTVKPSENKYTRVNILYTAPEEYKADTGVVYNTFSVIGDYYDIKLVSSTEASSGMVYGLYHNSDNTDYRQAVGSYTLGGEVKESDLKVVVYKRDTDEVVYSWDTLEFSDNFKEPAATLFTTNQGDYVVNNFYYGSGVSSDTGSYEFYDMDKYAVSKPADGEFYSFKKLTGEFKLKTREGEDFAEVCGLEPYEEITDDSLSFGVYDKDDFDLRNKANETGLVLEYTDGDKIQSWVICK